MPAKEKSRFPFRKKTPAPAKHGADNSTLAPQTTAQETPIDPKRNPLTPVRTPPLPTPPKQLQVYVSPIRPF
jgi:hypothetical protein